MGVYVMTTNFTPMAELVTDFLADFEKKAQQNTQQQAKPPIEPKPSQPSIQSKVNDTPKQQAKPKSNKQATDGIFIVKGEMWESLFDDVINDYDVSMNFSIVILLTYLVLACGTGKDNVTSTWSSGAVYRYTGISPKLAEKAISWLAQRKYLSIVKPPEKNKSPIYKLIIQPDCELDIFLPNGLVTGVTGEKTALKRLYDEGNIDLVYLFIRLYAFQDKELDVVDPKIISHSLTDYDDHNELEELYNESNMLSLWGTYEHKFRYAVRHKSNFHDFSRCINSDFNHYLTDYEPKTEHESYGQRAFGFFYTLETLGLISKVYYACRGSEVSKPDEIDFICQLETKEQQAFKDKLMALSENKEGDYLATNIDAKSVVLPSDIKNVHFSMFYQLRYRTKLGLSKIMYAKQNQINRQISQIFEKLNSK